jgi:excisionase family DNA binding protein
MAAQTLYSVDQVAEQLGLHVRTVRNYIREGRLKASRIGKQYRIRREDLEAFTGRPVEPVARETTRRRRHVEVSSIVEVDAISPDEAGRITNGVLAAGKGREEGDAPLHVESIYAEERGRLKIILTGGLPTVASILRLINLYLEQP